MLLDDYKILRPKTTKIQSRNGVKYVYQVTGTIYNKEKKYTVDKRTCIGKMLDDEYMTPNEKFSEYYPELLMSEVEPPVFSDTLKVGAVVVIEKIIKELQLDVLIKTVFEDNEALIKDIINYMIIDETSTFQYYPDFMYNHPSYEGKIRSDSTISKMLKEDIDEESIKVFLKAWNNLHSDIEEVYISYDSTNMNTSAKGIELAEYGHAKDDEEKPQVNVSYVINQENSLPLLYEVYNGSVIDNSQCIYMIEKVKEYGYKKIGIIIDRGYFSKKNIDELRENGYEFILMVKDNAKSVQKGIEEVGIGLRLNNRYYIPEHKVYGTTLKKELFEKDKKEVYVHIYYDNIRAEETRNEWLESVYKMEKELNKKVEEKLCRAEKLERYEKLFKLKYDENGYLYGYERRERKIQEYTDKLGYFSIITSKEMSAEAALSIYRDRDAVEKMFRSLKSSFDYDKFGVHKDSSLIAKTHMVFMASIVRSVIGQKLKELVKQDKKQYTIPSSIRELEKIEVTKNTLGKYTRKYALTAKQKAIMKAFDMDEKEMDKMILERKLQ